MTAAAKRRASPDPTDASPAPASPPKLKIVYRHLDDLVPYARNARRHPQAQIDKLRASLAEFGWTSPILHADGELIAGHGRLLAAVAMRSAGEAIAFHGDLNTAPTIDLSHLSPVQRRAYVLADNRIAEDAAWDPETLRIELAGLMAEDFTLETMGFNLDQLREAIFPKIESGSEEAKAAKKKFAETMTYQIVVDCADEVEQATLLEDLRERGMKCKPLIL